MTTTQTGVSSLREIAAFARAVSPAVAHGTGAQLCTEVIALDVSDLELASALALLMGVESGDSAQCVLETDRVALRHLVGRVLAHFDDRQSADRSVDRPAGEDMAALIDALMLVGQRMIAHDRAAAAEEVIFWLERATVSPEVLRVLWGIYLLEAGQDNIAKPFVDGLAAMPQGDERLYLEALVESATNPAGAAAALQRVMAACTAQHVRDLAWESLQRVAARHQ